ncbi:MAG TPA: D-alanyl-D-alanine carboxypeptidase family protein [Xanthobacteraceae bacterium]|nr:D-alanyl-D-alanine carboxypeptidase family protein [Xanthobacteraceae bacterium]
MSRSGFARSTSMIADLLRISCLRICALGLALAIGCGAQSWAQGSKKDEPFQSTAPFAILIDAESGTVLYEKNADQLMDPSSMAKLMTEEYVFHAIQSGEIRSEEELSISENAWRRGGAPSHGATMFASIHSSIPVMDLLRGAIIPAGNDACIALAEGIAGGEPQFAELLNKRARDLGLVRSNFSNATGLPDPQLKMTSRELAKLAQHIIRTYPEFYGLYNEREFTWNKIRQLSRNPLLKMNIGADGMVTGLTKDGGYGLVGSAVQNGLRLIVVINGLKSQKDRADEAKRMLDWGFHGFEPRLLFAEGEIISQAKLYGGLKSGVPLVADGEIRLLVPRNTPDRIIGRVIYTGPVPAPIERKQQIGKLKVWRGENVVLEVPLYAGEDVERGSMTQRAFDAAAELMIGMFRAGVARL